MSFELLEDSSVSPKEFHLSDKRFWALCDANGSRPVVLDAESAKTKSFVYDRKFGLFSCSAGAHPSVMSLLLAWHLGLDGGVEAAEYLRIEYASATADRFLRREGTAFRSSLSEVVEAHEPGNLKEWELAFFGRVRFISLKDGLA